MGDDVADERAFQQSLQDIATSPAMGIKADNLQMVKMEFDKIAQTLSTKTSMIELSIPGPAPGTKVRWTFDVPSAKKTNNPSYNLPEAAMGSRYYIEGDFDYDVNGTPLMRNIAYSGVSSRELAGSTIRGGPNRNNPAMVDFVFYEYKLEADSKGNDEVREWIMEPGRNWQPNVETDTGIQDTVKQSTVVIYIVLDQSKSMSSQGISQVKEAVRDFIDVFVPLKDTPPVRPPQEGATGRPPKPFPTYSDNLPNYFFVDFAPLLAGVTAGGFGIGLGYEKAFADPFSIAFYADFISISESKSESSGLVAFDILVRPRWYPFKSAVGKWYAGAIVGYGMLIEEEKEESYYYYYGDYYGGDSSTTSTITSAFTIGLETGYKFVFGHLGLEPWLGFTVGNNGGFKFGVTLGYVW
jgi:hypothetical protein